MALAMSLDDLVMILTMFSDDFDDLGTDFGNDLG